MLQKRLGGYNRTDNLQRCTFRQTVYLKLSCIVLEYKNRILIVDRTALKAVQYLIARSQGM